MNFYQRANLSLGIGVILGLQLAISKWMQDGGPISGLPFLENFYPFAWIVFQFLFRVKVALDDHDHFHPKNNEGRRNLSKLIDFTFFVTSTFMYILAAGFSFHFDQGAPVFLAGLAISTLWALFDWYDSGHDIAGIFFINLIYGAVIIIAAIGWLAPPPATGLLIAILGLDILVSKTWTRMPDY